jgi:acyl-[acyl-carrier-protein]-phospholipid O-acyltransferase/long-chain-fatty-acid--[acyl-carrier-protein] ligase
MTTGILHTLLQLMYRVRFDDDRARTPYPDAVLYVAPHRALLDSIVLATFLPGRPVVVLPREELGRGLAGVLLRAVPHAIMDVNDPATVKKVMRLLAGGRSVVMYPEGRVVPAPGVMKNYDVPALIATKTGVSVVPVTVRYARGVLPGITFPGITLCMGQPVHVGTNPPKELHTGRLRRGWATQQLQRILEAAVLAGRVRHSIFEAFLDALAAQGRRAHIIEDVKEEPKTYGDLLTGSLAIGRWAGRRTRAGENVGVLLPNVIPTVCTILGLMAFGRVPAMLNYSAGPSAVRSACSTARVQTIITSRAFIEQARLSTLVTAISDLNLVYLEDIRGELTLIDKIWLKGFAIWLPRRVISPSGSNDPAVVVFTSGSEAHPKGVVLSHDAILANIRQIATVMDFTPADKILNALPLYHTYSFTAGLMLCLICGTRLFLYVSPLRSRAIPEIAYRRNVTGLYGTSTFLSYYAKQANPLDFHSVRYVISGGEKLGDDVARVYLEKFGLRVYEGYGATECGPVIALSTPQCYQMGTVGRLLPGIEHRLERVDGIENAAVLHLKGPNIMLGYYRHDQPGTIEPPSSIFGPGWYNTGDVVDVSGSGLIRVVGRVRRFAKIAGEMVSLDSIEEIAVEASPGHRHAAVLRTESASGETTVLFTTDPELTRAMLMQAARTRGGQELAVARRIVCVPEIPLLASGKTDYVSLRTIQLDQPAANEAGAEPRAGQPMLPYESVAARP